MQGTIYELWADIALGILDGRHTLKDEIVHWQEYNVDWNFVKRYIAEHKHEYPDYKE